MAAATAAVVAVTSAAATAYSANQQNKAAKRAYQSDKDNAAGQRAADAAGIKAVQSSPAAMFAPVMMGFATDVFGRAFAQHGIKMPAEQMKSAMGLDRIIANNAAGLPWNEHKLQAAREKAREDMLRKWGTDAQGNINFQARSKTEIDPNEGMTPYNPPKQADPVQVRARPVAPGGADAPSYRESAQGRYRAQAMPSGQNANLNPMGGERNG